MTNAYFFNIIIIIINTSYLKKFYNALQDSMYSFLGYFFYVQAAFKTCPE